jgi:hypothetical protein
MATITVSNSGGTREWTNVLTWVGGVLPLPTDNVIFTVTSGNLIINALSTIQDFNLSNFTGTITFNSALFINGNWHLGGGAYTYVQNGIQYVRKQGTGTITSNGVTWSRGFRFLGNGITTLTDDFNLSGQLEFQEGGTPANMVVNGFNIYHTGTIRQTNNGIISGSTKYWYQGSGTVWAQGAISTQISIDFYINTTGTFTMSGSSTNGILFGGNKELRVISGTLVTTGLSALTLLGRTIDFNGNTINNLRLINTTQTVTLLSATTVNTLTIAHSGSVTQTITGFAINTNNLSITGIGNATSITQGSTVINFVGAGTGTWSQVGTGAIRNNININKTGTLNITGTVYYNTGTLTYLQGTVNTAGSTLNIRTSTTLDTKGSTLSTATTTSSTGINFNALYVDVSATITNNSPLCVVSNLTINASNINDSTGISGASTYLLGNLYIPYIGQGSSKLIFNGLGSQSWTHATSGTIPSGGYAASYHYIINKPSGTLTLGAQIGLAVNSILDWIQGTVDTTTNNTTLYIRANCTLNTNGINWNDIVITQATITNNSLLTCNSLILGGSIGISIGNVTFSGTSGFTTGSLSVTTPGRIITLVSGITYNVTNNLNLIGTNASKITLTSGTPRAIFTLPYGATQNVKDTSATNIDSSLGQTILSSAGVLTNTLNWSIGSGNFFLMF